MRRSRTPLAAPASGWDASPNSMAPAPSDSIQRRKCAS
ncbi:Uncharacterised protein [Bordetella pertussis]|nr:Uncharacterised protein [Bordetella pertussis]